MTRFDGFRFGDVSYRRSPAALRGAVGEALQGIAERCPFAEYRPEEARLATRSQSRHRLGAHVRHRKCKVDREESVETEPGGLGKQVPELDIA